MTAPKLRKSKKSGSGRSSAARVTTTVRGGSAAGSAARSVSGGSATRPALWSSALDMRNSDRPLYAIGRRGSTAQAREVIRYHDPAMSESHRARGLHGILERPAIYDWVMRALGGAAARRRFVDEFLKPHPDAKLLDVGCGTAALLDHLPPAVVYVG